MKRILSCLGCLSALASAGPAHGPIVLWHADPQTSARIVWIEEIGNSRGTEGKWSVGRAGFGYGDGDDRTEFPGMKDGYDSIAIRRPVELPEQVGPEARLILEVNDDDGFVAWLDGREVARRHVEGRGKGMKAKARHEAGAWEAIPLGIVRDLIRTKAPVLALQGFNRGLDSSDFSLDARLVAVKGQKRVEVVAQRSLWEYLVDAVFENDHHVLKRTRPIRAGKVDEERGVPYLGDGSWGVGVRKIAAGKLKERPWLVTAKSLNHLWRIDLGEEGWTGTALSADGKKLDEVRRPWRR